MRITGGTLRGRILKAPQGMDTRPTADRVRESLFNILAHHDWGDGISDVLEGAVVLDAFAGTGALGIEALSRGAASCSFFEVDHSALKTLKENISLMKLGEHATVLSTDVTRPPKAPLGACASLVFLDPPYHKGLIERAVAGLDEKGWIAPTALLVCETAKDEEPDLPEVFTPLFHKIYGSTALRFYGRFTG